MAKIIRVESCAECPYLGEIGIGLIHCLKQIVNRARPLGVYVRKIWNTKEIPEWCPLEDAKEE